MLFNVYSACMESTIRKLVYNNKVVGFRVYVVNSETLQKESYDISSDIVLNAKDSGIDKNGVLFEFIKSISSQLPEVTLIEHKGRLTSKLELEGKIMPTEILDMNTYVRVVNYIARVYMFTTGKEVKGVL